MLYLWWWAWPPWKNVRVPTSTVLRPLRAARQVLHPDDALTRSLTWATMTWALGSGIFYSVSVLFFTRVVGLEATTVGVGLTVAGGFGVAGAFVAGPLADRFGAHRLLLVATAGQGISLLVYVEAENAWSFTVIACFVVGLRAAVSTSRTALLATHFVGPERIVVRARLRVVMNVFVGLGTVLAALALLADTEFAYTVAILSVGGLSLLSVLPLAGIGRSLRRSPGRPGRPGRPPGGRRCGTAGI
jgi:predicted MFS family arabinose efflux permease